jgi:hypothetical protein
MLKDEEIQQALKIEVSRIADPAFNRRVLQEYHRRKPTVKSLMSLADERLMVIALILAMLGSLGFLFPAFKETSPATVGLPVLILMLAAVPLFLIAFNRIIQKAQKPVSTTS